jgi:hypothetical protein
MKNRFTACMGVMILISCNNSTQLNTPNTDADKTAIVALLDTLNVAAAKANYKQYFDCYADSAVFTGTDATERWHKASFMVWSKPYFDKGKAWNFSAVKRNIYFAKDGQTAWFDELLNTQMKICRGSGVVTKTNGEWKIEQYILSTTVPNSLMDSVIALKKVAEDSLLTLLKK